MAMAFTTVKNFSDSWISTTDKAANRQKMLMIVGKTFVERMKADYFLFADPDFRRNSFGFMFVDCSKVWVKCDASKKPHS